MTRSHYPFCPSLLSALLLLTLAVAPGSLLAQDNSQGRYRPEGREIGREAAREFGERLFEVRTYAAEVDVDAFAAATIFYPLTLSFDAPMGGVVMVPGFRGTQANYDWWGPALASLGYAVLIMDTNTPEDGFEARKNALIAGVDFLRRQNDNPDSPLSGKMDAERIAIIGHSLGGGASLAAALELGDEIQAVIPLALYCCELGSSFSGDYGDLSTPTLIIASAEDSIAPPAEHARLLYDSIGADTARVYLEFSTGDHMLVANGGPDLATVGKFALAFLKVHVDGNQALTELLKSPPQQYGDKFRRYETAGF